MNRTWEEMLSNPIEGERYKTLFTGICDNCEREQLPANMSMCNECATKEREVK